MLFKLKCLINIIFLLLVSLVTQNTSLEAQNLFTSKKGNVLVSFKYCDTILTAISSDVLIKLDYPSAQIDLIVDVKDFATGIDSLDNFLGESDKTLHLIASLNLDYIDTKKHPIQNFSFKGNIFRYTDKSSFKKQIVRLDGKGKIEHISENPGYASCLLSLNFELNPTDIKTSYPFNLMNEYIKVEIFQTILKSN